MLGIGGYSMITPKQIIKSNRKTLSISIDKDGNLIVRAPLKLSLKKINSFLQQKEQWIIKKQKEQLQKQKEHASMLVKNEMFLHGKTLIKQYDNTIKKVTLKDGKILIPNLLQNNTVKEQRAILLWYKKQTTLLLQEQLSNLAKQMKVQFSKVSLSNSKNRWGTCDSKAQIKFNVRLAMLPPICYTYIMIHELAHLKQMNHSPKFYAVVESIMPNYKQAKQQLKQFNICMQLYR